MMKKFLKGAVLLAFLLTCGTQTAAAKEISVALDGQTIPFDTPPCLENGRVLVPMRGIMESLGYTVEWQQNTKTVQAVKGETTILMPLGSTQVMVNGKSVSVDAPAKLISGRTLIPLRFLAEYSGAEVVWDGAAQMVNITSEAAKVPAEKTIRDSLVYIETGVENRDGVGVVLSEDGLIATSYPLLRDSVVTELTFNHGEAYHGDIKVVGLDEGKGIVLLKVEKEGLHPVKTCEKYAVGDPIFLLNIAPDGRYGTFDGTITFAESGVFSISTTVSAGNAVFNAQNEVIGLNAYKPLTHNQWNYVEIPIADITSIEQDLSMSVEELRKYTYQPVPPATVGFEEDDGSYTFAWAPVYNAEKYMIALTLHHNGECPWVPERNTETYESDFIKWWVTIGSGFTYGEYKIAAVVNGEQSPWSEACRIR